MTRTDLPGFLYTYQYLNGDVPIVYCKKCKGIVLYLAEKSLEMS